MFGLGGGGKSKYVTPVGQAAAKGVGAENNGKKHATTAPPAKTTTVGAGKTLLKD